MNGRTIITFSYIVAFACLMLYKQPCFAAEQQQTDEGWILSTDLVGAYNPEALAVLADASYVDVYHTDNSPLWNGLYIKGGSQLSISPAYATFGAHFEWMPIAIAKLHFQYDYYHYFGQYGSLLTFDSGKAPFGKGVLKDRKGEEQSGDGSRFLFQPTLQAKFGNIIAMNKLTMAYYTFSGSGNFFYEQEYDTLLKKHDYLLDNQFQVFYEFSKTKITKTFLIGPYYEVTHARGAAITRKRLGLTAYYVPYATYKNINNPRVYLQTGYNIQDRNRHHEFYAIAGMGFDFNM